MLVLRRLKQSRCSFEIYKEFFSLMKANMSKAEKLNQEFTEIKEGKARILFESSNSVFYNNVQEFNRDITIAVITEFAKEQLKKKGIQAVEFGRDDKNIVYLNEDTASDSESTNELKRAYPGEVCEEGISILEALSATGLRSVRLAKEVPGVKKIIANDISTSAVEAIKRNIVHNDIASLVEASENDASILMYQHKHGRSEQFDVIDIDPYGSASPFLDAAVQAVKPQGLLCVTCTDMAVMAGNSPETCWAKYHSMPVKSKACHEQALRILLGSIEQHANRYSRYIEPLISVSVDFYIRVFVKVHYGLAKVKMSASKQAYLIRCGGCTTYHLQPVGEMRKTEKSVKYVPGQGPPVAASCEWCGHRHSIGGPLWADSLYNLTFLQEVLSSVKKFPSRLKTSTRIKGFLTMMSEELQDVPLHYVVDELSSVMKCDAPSEAKLRSAILNAGYRVSSFHGRKSSLKTDAPPNVIWDIMKTYCEHQKFSKSKLQEGTPAYALMNRTLTTEKIDFTIRDDAEQISKKKGMVRFPVLPENWGPKARAKENSDDEMEMSDYLKEKSRKFQGKRKSKSVESEIKRSKNDEANENA